MDDASCNHVFAIPGVAHPNMSRTSPCDVELAAESLQAVDPMTKFSIVSDVSLGTGLPASRKRKVPEASRIDDVGLEGSSRFKAEPSSKNSSHIMLSDSQSKSHEEVPPVGKSCENIRTQTDNDTIGKPPGFCSVDSVDPKKDERITSSTEHVACDWSRTAQQLVRSPVSGPSLLQKFEDDDLQEQKPHNVADANQSPHHALSFDLNEDLTEDNVVWSQHSNIESGDTYHFTGLSEPVAVVARIGVPAGLPTPPLQFDGKLGWKRGAATSAFRRRAEVWSSHRNNGTTENPGQCIRGVELDLNVAIAAEDDSETELVHHPIASQTSKKEASVKIGPKHPERCILDTCAKRDSDKNCVKSGIQGPDLNDTCNDAYRTGHGRPSSMQQITVGASASLSGPRPAYWVDLRAVPSFVQVQAQPFLAASPDAFSLTQQMQATFLPPLSGQHGAMLVPQISGSMPAAYPGSVHLLESAPRYGPSGLTNMRPNVILIGGLASTENARLGANLLVPVWNTTG